MAAQWYVLHTYAGQEARAKAALLERVKTHGREEAIEEVFIPEENVTEFVKGQRKTSKRKFLPGYILVKMELDDELWHIVKNTSKVTGFVSSGAKPTPIPDSLVAFLSRASCATGTADSRMRVAARRYAANRNASAPSSSSRSARSSNCSASWAFEGSVCATRRGATRSGAALGTSKRTTTWGTRSTSSSSTRR